MELTVFFRYVLCPILLGGLGAWALSRYGRRLKIMDKPTNRSSHVKNIPKGGSIGILAAFIVSSLSLGFSGFFWLPAVFLSLICLLGDRVELPIPFRLLVQTLCTIIVLGYYFFETDFGYYALFPFMVLFVVGTANFYNFMDGIDGIAGISSVLAFGLLGVFMQISDADVRLSFLAASMVFSSLAFLFFNLPVARVFMGDVGSVFLGFVFSVLVIFTARDLIDFVCMAGFLFLFYMDEFTTMIIRLKKKESLFKAHRKHLYQILANEMGKAHWKISSGYGACQLMIGTAAIFLRPYGLGFLFFLYGVCAVIFIWFSNSIRKKAFLK
jgi:Fuc2NAc and GlcNAc transferase